MTNWTQEQEAAARVRCDVATKGPWISNSYSTVIGTNSQILEYEKVSQEWEDAGKPDAGSEPWRSRFYDADAIVCHVPAINGDTAGGRHAKDMQLIAHARTDLPDALDESQRLREELIEVWPHRALRCPCSERQRERDIDNPAPWTECTCGLNEALYAVH